jgi:hypothetical protein
VWVVNPSSKNGRAVTGTSAATTPHDVPRVDVTVTGGVVRAHVVARELLTVVPTAQVVARVAVTVVGPPPPVCGPHTSAPTHASVPVQSGTTVAATAHDVSRVDATLVVTVHVLLLVPVTPVSASHAADRVSVTVTGCGLRSSRRLTGYPPWSVGHTDTATFHWARNIANGTVAAPLVNDAGNPGVAAVTDALNPACDAAPPGAVSCETYGFTSPWMPCTEHPATTALAATHQIPGSRVTAIVHSFAPVVSLLTVVVVKVSAPGIPNPGAYNPHWMRPPLPAVAAVVTRIPIRSNARRAPTMNGRAYAEPPVNADPEDPAMNMPTE